MSGNADGGRVHQRANTAVVAEQAVRAYELRLTGMTIAGIAAELGLSVGTVHNRIERHLADYVDPRADEYRKIELDRLDRLNRTAYEILEADHFVAQLGKLVRDEHGNPLRDDSPKLQAIDRILRISERRAKLLGLDAPTATRADITVTRVDPRDLELTQLLENARQRNEAEEAELRAAPTDKDITP